MARVIETEQKKKRSKIKTLFVWLLIIALIAGAGFALWKFVINKEDDKKPVQVAVELDNLKDYGYVLTDRDSKYFKSEFANLKKMVQTENVDLKIYSIIKPLTTTPKHHIALMIPTVLVVFTISFVLAYLKKIIFDLIQKKKMSI